MKDVFLFHADIMQHYRIGVYNYLHSFLKKEGYYLTVVTEGHQAEAKEKIEFPEIVQKFSFFKLMKIVKIGRPWACIIFINHGKRYFFPFLLFLRLTGHRIITWTHGLNLQKRTNILSRLAHHLEHDLCHRIILYSESLKKYLAPSHRLKAWVANNTINLNWFNPEMVDRNEVLKKYGIHTDKNIIYSGRITRRKRVPDLIYAFEYMGDQNAGLILIGPDEDNIMSQQELKNPRIYYLGPVYGREALELLSSADVSCIPGAVGLGIVDAMYCGLPVVTEDVPHGPEIMYLKEGINGFMVPQGDIISMAQKLALLLKDDELRKKIGESARKEISTNGHIDKLCDGFLNCLKSLEKNQKD
ncbi:MAG: glycosyltransferase family 4 protein [Candidatus Aminicenantes bacterium]|nr:glycosyltransferase family 4 protein [Candidatus Aminicenantes bacterium]